MTITAADPGTLALDPSKFSFELDGVAATGTFAMQTGTGTAATQGSITYKVDDFIDKGGKLSIGGTDYDLAALKKEIAKGTVFTLNNKSYTVSLNETTKKLTFTRKDAGDTTGGGASVVNDFVLSALLRVELPKAVKAFRLPVGSCPQFFAPTHTLPPL